MPFFCIYQEHLNPINLKSMMLKLSKQVKSYMTKVNYKKNRVIHRRSGLTAGVGIQFFMISLFKWTVNLRKYMFFKSCQYRSTEKWADNTLVTYNSPTELRTQSLKMIKTLYKFVSSEAFSDLSTSWTPKPYILKSNISVMVRYCPYRIQRGIFVFCLCLFKT